MPILYIAQYTVINIACAARPIKMRFSICSLELCLVALQGSQLEILIFKEDIYMRLVTKPEAEGAAQRTGGLGKSAL